MIVVMMMTMITKIIIIITICSLNDTERQYSAKGFFHNLLSVNWMVSNMQAPMATVDYVQITCNTSGAFHVQHVKSNVVWKNSLAIHFDSIEIAFFVCFTLLAESETISWWKRGKNWSTWRKPPATNIPKMPCTKSWKLKPQLRLEPAIQH